ncbi:MAG: chromosome partitioning protein [Treponema sp.]|jgi:phage shock protein A|nr:chromosome partitioning protein [Treponema sp.]
MIQTEQKPEDLTGMNVPAAQEYIARHIATLKLTEKQYQALGEASAKWTSRIELARSKGAGDLALEAEKEADRLKTRQESLEAEIKELKAQIETMRKQLPGLAARERTIDPDRLEQELLMAMPGEEEKAEADRRLRDMEKDASAEAALAALKAKLGAHNSGGTE